MIKIIQPRGIHQCLLLLSLWTSITLQNEVTPGAGPLSGPCDPPAYCIGGDTQGDPEDCKKYYLCDNGDWRSQDCPPGTEENSICYHVDQGLPCDWCTVNKTECQGPCPTTTPNTGPTVTEAEPAPCDEHKDNCESDILYPDQHYCDMYWTCTSGTLTGPSPCAPGTVFDFDAQDCVQMHEGLDCDSICPVTTTSNPTTEMSTTVTEPMTSAVQLTTTEILTEIQTNSTTEMSITVTKPITSTLDATTSDINTTVISTASQITTEDMYSTPRTTHEPTTMSRYTTVLITTTQNDITTLPSTTSELSTTIAISTPTSASSSDSTSMSTSESTIPGTVPMSNTQTFGESTEVSTTVQPTNPEVTQEITTKDLIITTTTSTSTDTSPDTDWIIIVGCVLGGLILITLFLAGFIIFIKCRSKNQKKESSGPSPDDLYLTSGPHDIGLMPSYVNPLADEQHILVMDDTQTSSSTGVNHENIYNYISLDFDDHRDEDIEDTADVTHNKQDDNTDTLESDIGLYDILYPDHRPTLSIDHVYTTLT